MKMKKWITTAVATILIGAVCFTGCDFLDSLLGGLGHLHSYDANAWVSDATGHWHDCSLCEEKVDFSAHRYLTEEAITCSVCGWVRSGNGSTVPGEVEEGDFGNDNPVDPPAGEVISNNDIALYANGEYGTAYGYTWLATQSRASAKQSFYRKLNDLAQTVWNGTAWNGNSRLQTVTVEDTLYYQAGSVETSELTKEEADSVYQTYCYDHPYDFWLDQVRVSSRSQIGAIVKVRMYMIVVDEYATYSALVAAQLALNDNIRAMYSVADGATTEYEVAAAYYEAIAKSGDYTYQGGNTPASAYWAHSIVGIFDNTTDTGPVCEGYARALQMMLNLRGVDNAYCVGVAAAVGTGGGGGHAWNMAKLEDNWYYFDVTWDDANDMNGGKGGTLDYNYFAMSQVDLASSRTFTQTHFAGSPSSANGYFLYDLPTAAASPYTDESTEFLLGRYTESENFEYIRNGMHTVGIRQVKSRSLSITIPRTVRIDDKVYTVTEIGPYYSQPNRYASVFRTSGVYNRTVELPDTITALRIGAFCDSDVLNIRYHGTQEQWDAVLKGQNAFKSGRTPNMVYLSD